MARGSNRRKIIEAVQSFVDESSSSATAASGLAASHDAVIYYINLVSIDDGSITFKIQTSPNDGTTWFDLTSGEMLGNTSSITSAGQYHVSSQAPFGTMVRLAYTIVTGPCTFAVFPCFERSGSVF